VVVTAVFGALTGLNEGIYRGLDEVVDSPEMKKQLRRVGQPGADVVGALYVLVCRTPAEDLAAVLEESRKRPEGESLDVAGDSTSEEPEPAATPDPGAIAAAVSSSDSTSGIPADTDTVTAMQSLAQGVAADLEAFRSGSWEVNVRELKQRAREVKRDAMDVVLPPIKESIRAEFASLQDGKDAELLDWFIDTFGEKLLTNLVVDEFDQAGLKDPIVMVWEGLEGLARESGDPDAVSHATLAGHLPNRVLHATAVYPTRLMVRGNEVGLIVLWLIGMILPIAFFQAAEISRTRFSGAKILDWLKRK
jgi:hypothetical protein